MFRVGRSVIPKFYRSIGHGRTVGRPHRAVFLTPSRYYTSPPEESHAKAGDTPDSAKHHTLTKPIKPQYATQEEMKKAIQEIQQALGEGSISTDDIDLESHGYSEWSSTNIDRLPIAVAFPESTEQVSTIARICLKYRVPMIPFSGGSSVEGHFSAPFGGVSVDFAKMNKIVAFHPEDMDVVVQPSVSWMDLNREIEDSQLFFPVDPGPPAKIGGMIATNCSGTNAVRYGTMKDWVVNLTVVLPDGRILKTRQRPRKSSAGYNLNGIFTGSEGTLGFVTEATLKLVRIPEETGVAVTTFPTIRAAAKAAIQVVHEGIPVGAVEILDDVQMDVINRMGATGREWKRLPTLFFKFSGTKAGVQDNIDGVRRIVHANQGQDFEFEKEPEKQHAVWSARKEALWSMLCLKEEGNEVWSTDVAVPLSRVPDIVEVSKKDLDKLGLFGSMLGHIGDGNFHETILFDGTKEREMVKNCVHDMVHRAIEMEGTCTGEHGIGLGKKEFLANEVGEESVAVMRSIKAALDPLWLMNPGKVFDP
ncbi:D-lactate dehydrogenase mitochondrial precursor [Aspergillus sclerotiicarbonarius CBS 121057]|uniref:D-lactate dehydrogenase (cytochrome) n=1 Tax=Aspergillus sclerotiicarbonarius (strain CBS 121057 / IBT 28362) TaxID=1448318 RepID=A0A319F3K8_ASPSB|nr:D-lactate dehydrogenase mitochondrial precursor [Aspergillus sclerotiicarbonarius CBS 121057]